MRHLGGLLAVLGHVLINLGVNLMKLAHTRKRAGERAPLQVAWQLGALTFFVGTSCNFVALSLTAQAVVSAIGSLQFVSNVVFARALLKEAITVRTVTATLLILSADATLVLSSTHAESPHTVADLASLFQQSPFLIYLASSLSASCVLALLRHRLSPKVQPLAYSISSAAIGAQSVLLAKCLSTLLRATIQQGDNQLKHWFLYADFVCMVLTQLFWLTRLNIGLGMFDALTIVPTMQICWTLFSLAEGLIFFKEYKNLTSLFQVLIFACCIATIMVGVFMLAPSKRELEKKQLQQQQYQQQTQQLLHDLDLGDDDSDSLIRRSYDEFAAAELGLNKGISPVIDRSESLCLNDGGYSPHRQSLSTTRNDEPASFPIHNSGHSADESGNKSAERPESHSKASASSPQWWHHNRRVAAEEHSSVIEQAQPFTPSHEAQDQTQERMQGALEGEVQPRPSFLRSLSHPARKAAEHVQQQLRHQIHHNHQQHLLQQQQQQQPAVSCSSEAADALVHEQQRQHRHQQLRLSGSDVPLLEHALVPRMQYAAYENESAPQSPVSRATIEGTTNAASESRGELRRARRLRHSYSRPHSFIAYSPAETLAVDLPLDLGLLTPRTAASQGRQDSEQQQWYQCGGNNGNIDDGPDTR